MVVPPHLVVALFSGARRGCGVERLSVAIKSNYSTRDTSW